MIGVIIQARLGSTRMPGKTMKKINGDPLLYYSVKRASLAKYVDKVIVATTINKNDDEIENWCIENNILCYRGSEDNVLDRYYKAAEMYNLDTVIRVTSDCPFIDPTIIDLLYLYAKNYDYDDVVNRWHERTWPHGLDLEVFKFSALQKAWKEADEPYEKEHVTPYILKRPEIFNIVEIPYKNDLSHIRLTVDYKEDFEFTERLMEILLPKYGIEFTWKDILTEINKEPELLEINKMYIVDHI